LGKLEILLENIFDPLSIRVTFRHNGDVVDHQCRMFLIELAQEALWLVVFTISEVENEVLARVGFVNRGD